MPLSDYVPYAQIASSIAATIGLCFTATGLCLTAWQLSRTRSVGTLQSLQEFYKATNEREAALAKAPDDKRHAFIEFMNFLEVYSAASNNGLLTGVTLEIVNDKLIDSIALLKKLNHWHSAIEASVTGPTTYKHLCHFISRHKRAIEKCLAAD